MQSTRLVTPNFDSLLVWRIVYRVYTTHMAYVPFFVVAVFIFLSNLRRTAAAPVLLQASGVVGILLFRELLFATAHHHCRKLPVSLGDIFRLCEVSELFPLDCCEALPS
jgi:hypothetical protein